MKYAMILSSLAVLASAQPHGHQHHHKHKREIAWVTSVEYAIETVDVTTTIWVTEGEVPATSTSSSSSVETTTTQSAAEFYQASATASSTTSAVIVVPTTSSVVHVQPPVTTSSSSSELPPSSSSIFTPVYVPETTSSSSSSELPSSSSIFTPVYVPQTTSSSSSIIQPTTFATSTSSSSSAAAVVSSAVAVVSSAASSIVGAVSSIVTSALTSGSECVDSTCSGDLTFYTAGLGACGYDTDGSTVYGIALPHEFMGTASNSNPYCNMTLEITYGSTTVQASVIDKCMGCDGESIDLTNALFDALGIDEALGRVKGTWKFTGPQTTEVFSASYQG